MTRAPTGFGSGGGNGASVNESSGAGGAGGGYLQLNVLGTLLLEGEGGHFEMNDFVVVMNDCFME